MVILLLVIVLVIAACGVYVAASFDRRIIGKIDPLFKKTAQELSSRTGATGARTDQRVGSFAALLAVNLENARKDLDERMSQLDARISQAVAPLAGELAGLKDLVGQISKAQAASDHLLRETSGDVREIKDSAQEITRQTGEITGQLTVGTERSARDTDDLRALLRQVTAEHAQAGEQLAAIGQALDRQAQATARGERHDRRAADQMLATAQQVQALLRGQADVIGFLRATLDDESRSGDDSDRGRRVILIALPTGGQEDDIVRELAAAFSDRIMLTGLLAAGAAGEKGPGGYFAWRPAFGERLDDVLTAVLAACPDSTAAPLAGLDELRGLLLALRASGSGTVRIGRLIMVSTGAALLGAVVNAEESEQLRARPELQTTDDIADWLRSLGYGRVVELTEWADGYLDGS